MTIYLRRNTGGAELNFRPGFPFGRADDRDAVFLPRNPSVTVPQSRARNERGVKRWSMRWRDRGEGQRWLLENAWAQAVGPVLVMKYTEPGDLDVDAYDVAFVEDSLVIERTGPNTYDMAVEIEQVL